MGRREVKTFMVTREQIEDYQFTKKQIAAYNSLMKAAKRCEASGLSLFGRQWELIALPTKFYMGQMTTKDRYEARKNIECPTLSGASLSDSGADDADYIIDKFIVDDKNESI